MTQNALGGDLEELEEAGPTPLEQRALNEPARRAAPARVPRRARCKQRLDGGEAAGRIRIPSIGANFVVLDGTTDAYLRKGPGFFPETPFPGSGGTTAIAGHRTTYGAPFRNVDELDKRRHDRRRDAVRALRVRGRADADRRPGRVLGHQARRLRAPRAVRVPSAVQRGAADRRLRAAGSCRAAAAASLDSSRRDASGRASTRGVRDVAWRESPLSMDRQMLVKELKERVARHAYDVDCRAVAEAFLARHARCSNPLSDTSPWATVEHDRPPARGSRGRPA